MSFQSKEKKEENKELDSKSNEKSLVIIPKFRQVSKLTKKLQQDILEKIQQCLMEKDLKFLLDNSFFHFLPITVKEEIQEKIQEKMEEKTILLPHQWLENILARKSSKFEKLKVGVDECKRKNRRTCLAKNISIDKYNVTTLLKGLLKVDECESILSILDAFAETQGAMETLEDYLPESVINICSPFFNQLGHRRNFSRFDGCKVELIYFANVRTLTIKKDSLDRAGDKNNEDWNMVMIYLEDVFDDFSIPTCRENKEEKREKENKVMAGDALWISSRKCRSYSDCLDESLISSSYEKVDPNVKFLNKRNYYPSYHMHTDHTGYTSYTGATVFQPLEGRYRLNTDYYDFGSYYSSLYPTIMQNF